MIPTPIPDAEIWDGATRHVIAPPSGDLTDDTIAAVEALVDEVEIGRRYSMRCQLEPGDLATLAAGGCVWVSFLGSHLHPFSVDVLPSSAPPVPQLQVTVTPGPGEGAPRFDAQVHGVPHDDAPAFVAGVVEALQKMLTQAQEG